MRWTCESLFHAFDAVFDDDSSAHPNHAPATTGDDANKSREKKKEKKVERTETARDDVLAPRWMARSRSETKPRDEAGW